MMGLSFNIPFQCVLVIQPIVQLYFQGLCHFVQQTLQPSTDLFDCANNTTTTTEYRIV